MGIESANWIGELLADGRYQVNARLGAGGMGYVYRAYDRHLECDVVIKVPQSAMMESPEFVGRFAREIKSLVKLVHPHVVKVTDVGTHVGHPFVVMQYLSGGSLRDRQRAQGAQRPGVGEALKDWLPQVASALDFIHVQGYIHRDVKPDNILFDGHGHVYLSDFGVAKVANDTRSQGHRTAVTGTGFLLGTAAYMAPELILGEACDGRADQYALAMVVYEMLAGRLPFEGATPAAVLVYQTTGDIPRLETMAPRVGHSLADAVHRSLSKDPRHRSATCLAFAQAAMESLPDSLAQVDTPFSASATTGATLPPARPDVLPAGVCPACGRPFPLLAKAPGKRIRCPSCQVVVQAPAPTPVARPEIAPPRVERTVTRAETAPNAPASSRRSESLLQAATGWFEVDRRRARSILTVLILVAGIIVLGIAALLVWLAIEHFRG